MVKGVDDWGIRNFGQGSRDLEIRLYGGTLSFVLAKPVFPQQLFPPHFTIDIYPLETNTHLAFRFSSSSMLSLYCYPLHITPPGPTRVLNLLLILRLREDFFMVVEKVAICIPPTIEFCCSSLAIPPAK